MLPGHRHDTFLGTDASRLTGTSDHFGFAAEDEVDLPAGTDLGGVTIVRLIAAGGMGRVYEAVQAAPQRPVAVKLMRDGLVSAAGLRRFEREANVLARLQHPHIAQIYSLGTFVRRGLAAPFFVMELVADALPITQYAMEQGLSVRDRVELLRPVCAAVFHGHLSGVIHRDLKPGNILVGDDGRPKVIDFGIARATDDGLAPESAAVQTAAGELLGTLHYMSPEQLGAMVAAGSASGPPAIDARTDVYALGLVLQELLGGEKSLGHGGLLDTPRFLQERRDRGLVAVAAACRRDRGVKAADGKSLAAIVGKCLEELPAARYQSAADLLADLDRWLADEPTLARPPAWHEAAWRWARRYRAAAAAAAGIAATLVVAVIGIGFFFLESRQQRRNAEEQLYLATVQRAADARDHDNVADAGRLLAEARSAAAAAGARPCELACIAATLDDAIEVLPGHGGGLTSVAFAADGRRAVTGSVDGTARIWTLADQGSTVLRGHEGTVWGVALSHDGRLAATASADKTVRLWEVSTGRAVAILRGHTATVYAVDFTPDDTGLVSGSRDKTARLWDVGSGTETRRFTGHEGTVYAVSIAADGQRLATGSLDKTVRLWEPSTARQTAVLTGHEERVFSVSFTPDGRRLASGSQDGTARIWDVIAATQLAVLRHPLRVNAVAFSADGRRLATGTGDALLRIWDPEAGRELRRLRGHADAVWAVAAAPAGDQFMTASEDATARLWDADGGTDPVLRSAARVLTVAFTADGGRAAIGGADSVVRLWDPHRCQEDGRFTIDAGRVNAVCFSPDGATLAAACDESGFLLPTIASADVEPVRLGGHDKRVYSIAFSPDGTRLVTASADRTARIWNRHTQTELASLPHPQRVFCAAFSPDGSRVATACGDRLVRIFGADSGREIERNSGHEGQVNWLAFSADGASLVSASSDATARIWSLRGGRQRHVLRGSTAQLWKAAWSPDGTRVAAASADGTVYLWDAASGRQVLALRGHEDQVWALAFAPDGGSLLTGSWDKSARLWGRTPAEVAGSRRDSN